MIQSVAIKRSFLVLFLLALTACFQSSTPRPDATERQTVTFDAVQALSASSTTVSSAGITVTFDKTADWDAGSGVRGFTATVTILNQSGTVLEDWDLRFHFLATITTMWNATFEYAETSDRYFIFPARWNATLANNQSRSFGFQGQYSGVFQPPTSYVLSGLPIGEQQPSAPITPACTLDTNFVITADWPNGDGSRGFVAELYLTNTGEYPFNWQLGFDLDATITTMWNASYTRDNSRYSVSPASWNTRIEPNETLSFGFVRSYTGTLTEPQDVSCGDSKTDTPPGTGSDAMIQRYNQELAKLSEAQRQMLAAGRLFWSGYEFVLIPSQTWRRPDLDGLSTFQAEGLFNCYLKEGVTPDQVRDHGTFYKLTSKAGTASAPVKDITMSFALPPTNSVINEIPPEPVVRPEARLQSLYALITGLGTEPYGFDFGIGYDETGWFMITLRQTWSKNRPEIPPHESTTTTVYRLQNTDGSTIVPVGSNTKPYNIDLKLEFTDNHIRATITPQEGTVWYNIWPGAEDDQGNPLPLTLAEQVLGTDEEGNVNRTGSRNPGNFSRDAFNNIQYHSFPAQWVPGISENGVGNRVSIEINAARDFVSPAAGTLARGIVVYNAKINGQPWDAANPDDPYHDHVLTCPSDYTKAYDLPENQGSTAAENAEDGFKIDINIKEDDIHRCDVNPNGEGCSADSGDPDDGPLIADVAPTILTFHGHIIPSRPELRDDYSAFAFSNMGTEELTYSILESADWLTITSGATGRVAPGDAIGVSLKTSCPGSSANIYETALEVSSTTGQIETVTVRLHCDEFGVGNVNPDPILVLEILSSLKAPVGLIRAIPTNLLLISPLPAFHLENSTISLSFLSAFTWVSFIRVMTAQVIWGIALSQQNKLQRVR